MNPSDRKYSKEHEWVLLDGDVATVGITHFAQDQLGDIVFVELPEEGADFSKDDVIGTIESVKAVSEIFAPVSGSIVEVNNDLEGGPETVNSDPYNGGWYCKIKLSDPSEMESLMDADAYGELTAG